MSEIGQIKSNKKTQNYRTSYKNPTPLYLVSQAFKMKLEDSIKVFVKENNLDEKFIKILCTEFVKMNNYYPKVVQKKNREKLQLV
jgi:hypothetical protein